MLRRLGYLALAAVLLLFLIRNPTGAATTVNAIGSFLIAVADGLSAFVSAF